MRVLCLLFPPLPARELIIILVSVKLTTDVPLPFIRLIDPDEAPPREMRVVDGVLQYDREPNDEAI